MTEKEIISILDREGAILRNTHVVLSPKEIPLNSGKFEYFHSDSYVWPDRIFENPILFHKLSREIAQRCFYGLRKNIGGVDFIVGPEKGGIALAQTVAYQMSIVNVVKAIYAEKSPQGFIIGRGFERHLKGKRVIVVDDVVTSGTAIRQTILAVCKHGGIPIGAYAICSRGAIELGGIPFETLCSIPTTNIWPEEGCSLCINPDLGPCSVRVDVNKYGQEFLLRKRYSIKK